MPHTNKKLYRSTQDRIILGVCAGLGEYFNVDAVLVRVGFVILGLLNGVGVLGYIILALIMPEENKESSVLSEAVKKHEEKKEERVHLHDRKGGARVLFGILLLVVGLLYVFRNIAPVYFPHMAFMSVVMWWPLILVVVGLYMIFRK